MLEAIDECFGLHLHRLGLEGLRLLCKGGGGRKNRGEGNCSAEQIHRTRTGSRLIAPEIGVRLEPARRRPFTTACASHTGRDALTPRTGRFRESSRSPSPSPA